MEEKNEAKQPETPAKQPAFNNDLRIFLIALFAAVIVITAYHLTIMVIKWKCPGGEEFVSCQCKRPPKGGRRKPQARPQKKTVVEKKAATPAQVTRKLFAAVKELDCAAAAKLCDGEMKTVLEKSAATKKELEAKAAEGDEKAKATLAQERYFQDGVTYQINDEKIENDLAVVDFAMIRGKEIRKNKICFKKVNGEWKVISDKDYEAAKKTK